MYLSFLHDTPTTEIYTLSLHDALPIYFLMVKTNMATREFVDRARLRGIEVHAWTVNDTALVAPLLDAGVANLITDDPSRMRKQLNEIQALEVPQRLLLRAAHAMALD